MKTCSLIRASLLALFLAILPAVHAGTVVNFGTISQISGPADPGLDLKGEMAYAINFSSNDPAMFVNGVTFTPDRLIVPALTVGQNQVAPWQTKPNFGAGIDQDNLEEIYQDIRYALPANGQALEAHLPVTSGQTYKLQVLVYGNWNGDNRRWDIEVEGAIGVDEFTSLGASDAGGVLPAYSAAAGVVYTYTYTATDSTLDVRMGNFGGGNDLGDRNPIWQALTLEQIVPDTDGDGLPDAWEMLKFSDLTSQTGAGDADGDGLSNQYEYQLGTNPNGDTDGDGLSDGLEYFTHRTNLFVADTDGDGLLDGAEITAGSNPFITDTDGDGLSDGAEVNIHHTSPIDTDSDDDDYTDRTEVLAGTNPNSSSAYPLYSSQVLPFRGGEATEGLDLTGNFIVAARFGVSTLAGSWPVRDANFIPYTSVPGLTQNAANEIAQWVTMNFASPTTNDNNLREVLRSIRYGSPVVNIAIPGLTPGRSYKVQLLFAEACCASRGFDVFVENALVADEFSPPAVQGGASNTPARGAAVVHGFVATDSTLNIRLDKTTVTTPALNDINAIINGLTVEEIPPGADLDGDTLPDQWEIDNFGNTGAQNAAGDPDNDGLSNAQELTSNTNPNNPDTDNDGLTDGLEVLTHGSNPRLADSDGDGLNDGPEITAGSNPNDPDSDDDTLTDGAEVNTHHTSPLSIDTDGDGYNDPTELISGTNPALASSTPGGSFIARVLGADAAEGLDLTGTFKYAFNVGPDGAAGLIHDADFTADSAAGITVSAGNQIASGGWVIPSLGSSPADDALEAVFRDIRWSDVGSADPALQDVKVDLANLIPGRQYKLQLLFGEQCCPTRTFDISVEGNLIADDFNITNAQGPTPMTIAGAAVIYSFTAGDNTLNILLAGAGVAPVPGVDRNATLSGVTLEEIVTPVPLDIVSVTRVPTGLRLDTRGTPGTVYIVDWAPDLVTWEEVNDNLVPDASGNATWTDTNLLRVGPAVRRGFYKLRAP